MQFISSCYQRFQTAKCGTGLLFGAENINIYHAILQMRYPALLASIDGALHQQNEMQFSEAHWHCGKIVTINIPEEVVGSIRFVC